LRALIDNVLENAARHGRTGGMVETMLSRRDGAVSLTVDDDGPGVPPDQRERIFERFARGPDSRTDGSGLGLALVRQQARLHGGEVSVSSGPLGGARFEVSLEADQAAGARGQN
jgi:two-component system sensor histidine kinase PrrB